MENNINKFIKNILSLEDDWDGNGAKKFDKAFVEYIENLAKELIIVPQIFPTVNGEIQFEFEDENNYLEFVFNNENRNKINAFAKWGNGKEVNFLIESESDNVSESLNIFLEGFKNLEK